MQERRQTGTHASEERSGQSWPVSVVRSRRSADHARCSCAASQRRVTGLSSVGKGLFSDLRSFGLKIEQYPCWRMVAGVYLPTRPSVYTTVREAVRQLRREQKVIKSHPFVRRPPFVFVIPESPERPVRM